MRKNFTKQEVIEIGNKLAAAGFVATYKPRSHSHNAFSLFPQTEAQYNWLKRDCGTTYNVVICWSVEEVLQAVPEVRDVIRPTKSKKMCRINISL